MPGYGAYQTAEGRWIYLLMLTDTHWRKFCTALQLPQAHDETLATLRNRKKAREQVEDIVKQAIGALSFDDATQKLKAADVGFTEVLPIERVLEPAQARQPGKLRNVGLRGLEFEVPEFPRLDADRDGVDTLPPPELGEHTLQILQAAGVSFQDCQSLIKLDAIVDAAPNSFPWAPVREKTEAPR
jgi:crotonobetainyl-CoA:carnitine CoA-transferase CaiB-like acyl-CoA transferase